MDERELDAFWMAKKIKGLPAEVRKRISYLIDDAVLLSESRSNAPPHITWPDKPKGAANDEGNQPNRHRAELHNGGNVQCGAVPQNAL